MAERIKKLKKYGFNTENRTYVIAEIGINHGGNVGVAKKLIDSAAKTGCDAVKFQTYITEKRVTQDSPIFDILKKCELPFSGFGELKEYARQCNLDFFSTPFDEESLTCLQEIECDLYKVASFDVVNHKFLSSVAQTEKPVILSVGMANIHEIKSAYQILRNGTEKIALLHCVSAYPTQEQDANLAAIYELQDKFDCVIGQSDHTNDIRVPLYAVAAGAQIIEKHYKANDDMDYVDGPVSITQKQTKEMVQEIRRIECVFGDGRVNMSRAQERTKQFRRYS
jgi:sialic acid synthase SpsE